MAGCGVRGNPTHPFPPTFFPSPTPFRNRSEPKTDEKTDGSSGDCYTAPYPGFLGTHTLTFGSLILHFYKMAFIARQR